MGDDIRIILGRVSELWWDGVIGLLEPLDDIKVVGVSDQAKEVIDLAGKLNPNLILLDEEISGSESIEVIQNIGLLQQNNKTIVVIKPYKNVQLASIFKAAANSYIDKDLTFEDLLTTIRYVAKGGVAVISRIMAKALLDNLSSIGQKKENIRLEYDVGLSRREMEVLSLLSEKAMTNKEIAKELFISENTVKAHLSSIMEKMKVRNRVQAAALAREEKLFDITL